MERETAAAYSPDLAGEGETDSASFRLRGEERDENVGGYIFGEMCIRDRVIWRIIRFLF